MSTADRVERLESIPRHGPVTWYLFALAGCVAAKAALSLILAL